MKNNDHTKIVSDTAIYGFIDNERKSTTTVAAKCDNEIVKRKFEIVTEGFYNYYLRFLTQRVTVENAP